MYIMWWNVKKEKKEKEKCKKGYRKLKVKKVK
jgi:hypothetical protein